MLMIGSGGSFSTATYAAWLHEHVAKRLSRASSPLEVIQGDLYGHGAVCFSASGRNRDIGVAFKSAAVTGASPLSALVMADATPLHKLAERYAYSDVVGVSDPTFKDGFLAVASMIASAVLLLRAYWSASGSETRVPASLFDLITTTLDNHELLDIADQAERLTAHPFTSVLYSNELKPAAVDLESRFVEAALGALHAADFRNFGHGRHFWFANRSDDTGVIALVSDGDQKLADRTLSLLPTKNVLRLNFRGQKELIALSGLVAGLYISLGAGRSAGIDPGKPGVPEFGRRLYRLGPSPANIKQKSLNRMAAIRRKTLASAGPGGQLALNWNQAYDLAVDKLLNAQIGAIVLDYDGTLCGAHERFGCMPRETAAAIERLASEGAPIAIATGRGPSAGQAMRHSIGSEFWSSILVGYYNGAVIMGLDDDTDPLLATTDKDDALLQALTENPIFVGRRISANSSQISITLGSPSMARHGISIASRVLGAKDLNGARIVASSHSIDLLLSGQSKLDVVTAIAARAECSIDRVLRIGDKGAWPGNDAELLDHELGLTVDEASPSPVHCWGLAPAGVKGVQASLHYLNTLKWKGQLGRFEFESGEKGPQI